MNGKRGMRSILLDLMCALRALRTAPFFTCVAAGTLVLGIALNTIIFSLVNPVLLHSLPYPDSGRLVILQEQPPHRHQVQDLSAPAFFFVKQHAEMLEEISASYPTEAGVNLSGSGPSRYARALNVSAGYFRTLRNSPLLGRTFDDKEDSLGGANVAVLSYALWKSARADHSDLGTGWRINGEEYAVIGVMPENFHSYPEADLWLPLQLSSTQTDPGSNYRVIARIRKGFALQDAAEELRTLSVNAPLPHFSSEEHAVLVLQKLQRFESQDVRQRLIFLSIAVFLVLLIVCANIAMLLLVRAVARSQEIYIRLVLGSPRSRLFQTFLLEGAIISVLGGVFGLILAKELLPFVLFLAPGLPPYAEVHLDWQVVEFTCGMGVLTALLLGVAIAVRLSRFEINKLQGAMSFRMTASAVQNRAARFILVLQTALTLILLSGAVFFLRHLLSVEKIEPGFEERQAAVAQVTLVGRSYETTAGTARVLDRILKRLGTLQFVEGAATISALPLEKGLNVPVRPDDVAQATDSVEYRSISPEYFSVMRIPFLQGRQFAADGPQTQHVAIVNEALAHQWWPATSALGHFITLGKELGPEFTDPPRLIVGVVADVHQSSLEQAPRPTVFVPVAQVPDSITGYTNRHFLTSIILRTPKPADIPEQVRVVIESADPDLSLVSFRSLSQVVRNSMSRDRFYTSLTVVFGGCALLITAIGFYGLLSYQIGLRTQEIAVRIAFGANRFHAVMLIVRQSILLVAAGVTISTTMYFFSMPLIEKLYNLDITLGALISGIALLVLVTILASLIAALRIASIEPVVILKNE